MDAAGDPPILSCSCKNKLKEAGVSLSSLTDAARGMAEDDVAGMVKEQASSLAEIMRRNGR